MMDHRDELGQDEEPPERVKGWWLPISTIRMYHRKEISEKELLLLATIDIYVDADLGIPCYAGNAHLARLIHVDVRTVQGMIQKLKKLGVVNYLGTDGRKRYLDTVWSRTPQWEILKPLEQARLIKEQHKRRHG